MSPLAKPSSIQIASLGIFQLDLSQSELVRIRDIMTKDAVSIDSSKSIKDAAKIMVESNSSSIIVTEDGEPIGIIREKDFVKKAIVGDLKLFESVVKIMSSPLIYSDPEQTVWDVIDLMKARGISSIPVISQKNRLLGMVKFSDFLKAFSFD